jgi:DNA-binding XRE family transcriptional regulator
LSIIAPTPGHLLQRFEKINEFPIRKRAEDPGVKSANKTPAIRDKAIHRVADNKVGMPAGINAIVLSPARYVMHVWYSHPNKGKPNYNTSLVVDQLGGLLWRSAARPYSVPSALVLFGSQLKRLREARDLSQEGLGELCNFERQYIGRIERGERVISFEGMMRIAFILQVRPADLYKQIPVPNRMPKKGEYKGQKKSGTKKVQV